MLSESSVGNTQTELLTTLGGHTYLDPDGVTGPPSSGSMRTTMKKAFNRSSFLAYDELLTLLLSEVHFPTSMNYFDALFADPPHPIPRFGEHQRILFEGIKGVCDIQIGFYPLGCIRKLFKNEWPETFELEYEPLQQNEKKKYSLEAGMTYSIQVLGGSFTQFWDKLVPVAEAKYGGDVTKWPAVLNFARVVRNSFAHGNRIHFQNPNAAPVSWRSIRYAPTDNGRAVLYNDMGLADFIVLFEEVSLALS
jgi:hypothetical protein